MLRAAALTIACGCIWIPTFPMHTVMLQLLFALIQVGLIRLHGRQKFIDDLEGWPSVTNVYSELPTALLALRLKAHRLQKAYGIEPDHEPELAVVRRHSDHGHRKPSVLLRRASRMTHRSASTKRFSFLPTVNPTKVEKVEKTQIDHV